MNTYFLNLFNYDRHTNLQILDAIFEAGQPQKTVQVMAHLLAAQQIWLQRCKNLQAPGGALWPDWQAVQFKYMIEDNHMAWTGFINQIDNEDFERRVEYYNSKGDKFSNKLVDILAHLINHGTHHRAQIGQHLKLAGLAQLPATDYIFYIRTQNQ